MSHLLILLDKRKLFLRKNGTKIGKIGKTGFPGVPKLKKRLNMYVREYNSIN